MEVLKEGESVCDFCSAPKPEWRLPALSFTVPIKGPEDFTSGGDWAACGTCLRLVQNGAKAELVNRAIKGGHPVPPRMERLMRQGIERLHNLFFKNWSGNVLPIGPPEPNDGLLLRLTPEDREHLGR